MRSIRISDSATRERRLREEALTEAATLFASLGGGAIDLLSQRLVDQSRSPEERRADRLALLEVERLDRTRRQSSSAGAMVVWKPAPFSRGWFAGLFARKRRHR